MIRAKASGQRWHDDGIHAVLLLRGQFLSDKYGGFRSNLSRSASPRMTILAYILVGLFLAYLLGRGLGMYQAWRFPTVDCEKRGPDSALVVDEQVWTTARRKLAAAVHLNESKVDPSMTLDEVRDRLTFLGVPGVDFAELVPDFLELEEGSEEHLDVSTVGDLLLAWCRRHQ